MVQYGTYCTQIGPDGSGHERCGGACLASVLLNDGWQSDPWALTVEVSDSCGITDRGATADQLLACAAGRGLDGRKFTYADDAEAALLNGEAVLWLCDNQYLEPRPYPAGYGWEAIHWIRSLVISDAQQMSFVYDPLTYIPNKDGSVFQGPTAMDMESILNAVRATPYAEAGIILTSRKGIDLNRAPE